MVFMLPLGSVAMRKARAQFAANFFAVAGFEVLEGTGYKTVSEGMEDAKATKADVIVVCSSDEEYADFAPEVKKLADKAMVVVAGFPKEIMDTLKAAGIEHFIHVKCNVLDTLTGFQKELGI
jgi:methylmalonyl-CoA mutase